MNQEFDVIDDVTSSRIRLFSLIAYNLIFSTLRPGGFILLFTYSYDHEICKKNEIIQSLEVMKIKIHLIKVQIGHFIII